MTEKQWIVQSEPPQEFFDEFPELPKIVAKLLYHRGLTEQKAIDEFLHPDYSQDIHDPFLFQDMEKTVARLFEAIEKEEKITIHGDYDADGVSGATILHSILTGLGHSNLDVFLPHREKDGYGLNLNTIKKLHEEGTNIIITCDCGISNTAEVALANELGMDVIITDHHSIPETIPEAFSIIHPKIPDEPYPDKELAGGAVAFKLAQALLASHKKEHELMPNGDKHESFEKWLLDMVAIASVADMVPLIGESRTLTKYGLIVLNKTKRVGMQKLLMEAGLMHNDGSMKNELNAESIGFQIAPRINAAGRLDHANVALKLFIETEPTKAVDLAFRLDQNNIERKNLTKDYVEQALAQVEKDQIDQPFLFVYHESWSPGIVGLIASRIKEKYYKPVYAMTLHNGQITGSGRSVEGFDMIATMQQVPEFFAKFGGHPMACGFSLANVEQFEEFKQAMLTKMKEQLESIDLTPKLYIDAEVDLEEINWDLYDLLDKFEPFGQKNPKPKYLAKDLTIKHVQPLGKDGTHIRIDVTHTTPRIRKTIGWRFCDDTGDTNWCRRLKEGDKIDIVFEVGINEWNGNRELQLTIQDLRVSE